ncbi:hypothetical protein L798_15433 [Zootermopsis nevadensis]|uniref:Uncharacterized protein n=1 Tax=Zootermopsis nevadensis TaxID=136037 RepID=A0A067QPI2_ZOONE|nr:hypothetical protein L798_15433 [Zootermopsis nevadensis]
MNDHPTRYRVTCGQHDEPPDIASFPDRITLLIVSPQFSHDAGLAPVPYTGRKLMRKFPLPQDSNQRAFRIAGLKHDASDRAATAWDMSKYTDLKRLLLNKYRTENIETVFLSTIGTYMK